MNWTSLAGIARTMLLWIAPIAILLSFLPADKERRATYASESRLEFTPAKFSFWTLPLLIVSIVYLVYFAAIQAEHRNWGFLDAVGTLGLITIGVMTVGEFPGSIVVTAEGLEQIRWLSKNKHIQWEDIEEINTGEKSRTVTITAKDGTKIIHSRQLPDRGRLLLELKQHCGDNLPPDFPREPIVN